MYVVNNQKRSMNIYFTKGIIVFLLAFVSLSVMGQNFRGGLGGGFTATKISGDRDPDGGRLRLGAYGAVFTNYPVTDNSRLQLELMYIQKGSRAFIDGAEPDEDYRDYRLDLHYVEVPVVYKRDFSGITGYAYVDRLTLEAGLSFAKVVGHYEINEPLGDVTDIVAADRPFRWGEINILAGLNYPLYENLYFHFRFSQGVTPVRPHRSEERDVSGTMLNWIHQFGQYNTAYTFGLSYTLFAQPVGS